LSYTNTVLFLQTNFSLLKNRTLTHWNE